MKLMMFYFWNYSALANKYLDRTKEYYVGLSAIEQHAHWRWNTGEDAFLGEIRWIPGEPANRPTEECGAITASGPGRWGQWDMHDSYCTDLRYAICEMRNKDCLWLC